MRQLTILTLLALSLILSACGGGDGPVSTGGSLTVSANSGVVVDPYIANAVVLEVDAGGNIVQSATTNAAGEYNFSNPLTIGSTLQLKAGSLGQHAGLPYAVTLRRVISSEDTEPVVVSPLTTLIAEGSTPAEVVLALDGAGLTGLTEADLYKDPMAGLGNLTSATEVQLKPLQASLVVGSYLEAMTASGPMSNALTDSTDLQTLSLFVTSVQATLNAANFDQVASALAGDPTIATLTVGDFIQAAVVEHQPIVGQVRNELSTSGSVNLADIDIAIQSAVADMTMSTKNQYQMRVGQIPGSGVDGQLVFTNECNQCHTLSGGGTMDLSGKGSLIDAKLAAGHNGRVLTAEELSALATFLDGSTPTPPPTPQPVNGQTVYDNNCSGCHAVNGYDASGSPDLAAKGSLIPGKLGSGHNGLSLTGEEITAVAGFVDQYQAPAGGPDYSDCTACHAQPPNGNTFPNTAGAHLVHQALPGVGTDCSICHQTAAHNGNVDLAFPADYDAKSGMATDNLDGTCSNIICHGGQTTPDWWTGSIDVNTQCTSCHTRGTSQYNSQNSGQHGRSEHRNRACTVCHNTAKMGNHFANLATPGFETDPASTIGGGSTSVGSYSNGTCSNIQCHGTKSW